MTTIFPCLPVSIAFRAAACAAALALASCGGGVSANPSPVVDSPTLTILPATAMMYSGMPTTFVLSGGTGSYIVASSNQAIVPISSGVSGRSVTLVPNPVTAETTVTLTVRDTASAVPVNATLTVRPGTVNNAITITRTSTVTGCTGVALCSGGDAEVTVTLSQGGIPLPARGTRFDVVSGDYRFITTPPGTAPETLATTVTTVTDQTGVARARIRVLPNAANQTALLQVTDMGSDAFQRTSFAIAQVTAADASFYTVPPGIDFIGPQVGLCASATVGIFIFGGTPPYAVASSSPSFQVSTVAFDQGGRNYNFSVSANGGPCPSGGIGATIVVTDSAGRTRQVPVTNKPTTDVLPALVVAPETVALESCFARANVTVAGGTGSYFAAGGSGALDALVFGGTMTISRRVGSTGFPVPPGTTQFVEVSVGVSDGLTTKTVTVRLYGFNPGQGGGNC